MQIKYRLARWGENAKRFVNCDPEHAVQRVVERASALNERGQIESLQDELGTLAGFTGQLLGLLIDNGVLRKEQVELLLGSDFVVED